MYEDFEIDEFDESDDFDPCDDPSANPDDGGVEDMERIADRGMREGW